MRTGGSLPDPRRVRRARHPGDRLRLRAARRQHPRARRVATGSSRSSRARAAARALYEELAGLRERARGRAPRGAARAAQGRAPARAALLGDASRSSSAVGAARRARRRRAARAGRRRGRARRRGAALEALRRARRRATRERAVRAARARCAARARVVPAARAGPPRADGLISRAARRARATPWRGRGAGRPARARRSAAREEPSRSRDIPDDQLDAAIALAEALGDALADSVARGAARRAAGQRDAAARARRSIGRVSAHAPTALELTRGCCATTRSTATSPRWPRRCAASKPLLVVGERGQRAARAGCAAPRRRLADDGWMTFEAGAAEINAGHDATWASSRAACSGSCAALDGERVLWIAPAFEALLYAGVHAPEPARAASLDLLLRGHGGRDGCTSPAIVDPGRLRAAGARAARACATRSTSCGSSRWTSARTLALAAAAAPGTDRAVLREALALGRHFLGDARAAGRAALAARGERRRQADDALTIADVLATITERSGLPLSLLDERERLDVDALRRVLRRAGDRPAGGGRVHGRARRADQGGADRPDAPAGRAAVRRADRHGQDRDRQGAGRVPVRLAATG